LRICSRPADASGLVVLGLPWKRSAGAPPAAVKLELSCVEARGASLELGAASAGRAAAEAGLGPSGREEERRPLLPSIRLMMRVLS
jgi:hypothetical protein